VKEGNRSQPPTSKQPPGRGEAAPWRSRAPGAGEGPRPPRLREAAPRETKGVVNNLP